MKRQTRFLRNIKDFAHKTLRKARKYNIANNLLIGFLIICVAFACLYPTTTELTVGGVEDKVFRHGSSKDGVSLMFNVYSDTQSVENILKVLETHNAKATFFVGGCWADDNVAVLKKIKGAGHELANHGYFHKDHKKLNYQQNEQEIVLTDSIIRALCGVKPTLFAPPSGSFSNQTLEVAFNLNYKVIMWSKDTIDWRDKDGALIIKRATANLENGDLVLMHPKEHTLKVLPDILSYYESVGFNVVTVSENLMD